MRKHFSIILSVFALATIIVITAVWIRAFYSSIQNYRSPLQKVELKAQPAIPPRTSQVVMVLISGLGYEASLELGLPVLEQLKRSGADMAVQSFPPTYSQTAWATLISGAPPETNDAPPFDVPSENLRLLEIDTIFARTHAAGLSTALLATADWRKLIPRNQLDYTFFVQGQGAEADEIIIEAALPLITAREAELILIHLTGVEFAGQYLGGAESEAYLQAANRVDAYLGQIIAAVDFSRSVLMVLSDHGHIPDGGHGGSEDEVIWQPLVITGENVVPGSYSDVQQVDIAPTLSVLLGVSPPTASQGRILYEMLRLDGPNRAAAQLSLAQQRVILAKAYLNLLDMAPTSVIERLETDLAGATKVFNEGNTSGAFQLALLAQQEADNRVLAARNSRINAEMLRRLALIIPVVFFWLAAMWRWRGPHAGLVLIISLITLGLYHGLFQLQGYSYSVSSITDFSNLPVEIVRRLTISLLVGGTLLLTFLLLVREENWETLIGTGYGYGLLITFMFATPLFWAFWHNGFVASWRLPAIVPTYWQIHSLLETMVTAVVALLLPWPIMSISLLINLIRRHVAEERADSESDALRGLRL